MRRVICLIFLFVCLLTSCIPSSSLATNNRQVIRKNLHSSVSIQLEDSEGWTVIGGGTVVRKHSDLYFGPEPRYGILTAQHVLEGDGPQARYQACSDLDTDVCVPINSFTRGGATQPGSGLDWALVFIRDLPEPMRPARVRQKPLVLGESLIIMGHPWGRFIISDGIYGASGMDEGMLTYTQIGFAAHGTSGGGWFDSRGRLAAVTIAIAVRPTYLDMPGYQHAIVYGVPVDNVVW